MKLYENSSDYMTTELNIVKVMKTIKEMKIFLKSTLMSDFNIRFEIKHAPQNILNCDNSTSDEEDENEHGHSHSHGHGHQDAQNEEQENDE